MILITGGTSSGKATFARNLAAQHGWREDDVAFNVEELLWGQVESAGQIAPAGDDAAGHTSSKTLSATPELIERLAAKAIVTCSEVGAGIVPLDAQERAWREAVGRMSCELASQADVVVRMVCGIPVVLKGELA